MGSNLPRSTSQLPNGAESLSRAGGGKLPCARQTHLFPVFVSSLVSSFVLTPMLRKKRKVRKVRALSRPNPPFFPT